MTNEQYEYEQGMAAQAEAEYQAELEYFQYLDELLENKQYDLHAVEIALNMLNSKEYANSNLNHKQFLEQKRIELQNNAPKTNSNNEL